eukprot:COSAG04_NODE_980_length_9017_cov_64.916797_6_plen_122_part_00
MQAVGGACVLALCTDGSAVAVGPTVAEAIGTLYSAEHAATIQAHAELAAAPFRAPPKASHGSGDEEEPADFLAEVSHSVGSTGDSSKLEDAVSLLQAWKRMLATLPEHADFAAAVAEQAAL